MDKRTLAAVTAGFAGCAVVALLAGTRWLTGDSHSPAATPAQPKGGYRTAVGTGVSIHNLVSLSDTIAEIRVADVGPRRFNTESGEELSQAEMETLWETDPVNGGADVAHLIYQTIALEARTIYSGTLGTDGYVVDQTVGGEQDGEVFQMDSGSIFVDLGSLDGYPDGIVFMRSVDDYVSATAEEGLEPFPATVAVLDTAWQFSAGDENHEAMQVQAWFQFVDGNAIDHRSGATMTVDELTDQVYTALSVQRPEGRHRAARREDAATSTAPVKPLMDGGPDHVSLLLDLVGDPHIGQPSTFEADFMVPEDGGITDIQGGTDVEVVAQLFLPEHYTVESAAPTYDLINDSIEPDRRAYEWLITSDSGVTNTLRIAVVPTESTGRFEPVTFLVMEAHERYLSESTVLDVRVGGPGVIGAVVKLR